MYELSARRALYLEEVLRAYMREYRAFRAKPCGAPGSKVRIKQDWRIALEDTALAAIRGEETKEGDDGHR